MSTRDPLAYGWWLSSRAAGVVAFAFVSASVVLGLAMANRVGPARLRARLRASHERIAVVGLVALVAHGLLLLPDPWLKPGLSGVLVPGASPYRPFWTALGVCAGYLALALGLSFYARRTLGTRRWRRAHRYTPVVYVLGVVHVLGAGTDAASFWMRAILLSSAAAIAALLAQRLVRSRAPLRA
jgi:sulfoxide reductase heme-binding subunit YedZ